MLGLLADFYLEKKTIQHHVSFSFHHTNIHYIALASRIIFQLKCIEMSCDKLWKRSMGGSWVLPSQIRNLSQSIRHEKQFWKHKCLH